MCAKFISFCYLMPHRFSFQITPLRDNKKAFFKFTRIRPTLTFTTEKDALEASQKL